MISNQANERYAHSISALHAKETLDDIVGSSCKPHTENGRRYRALNPWQTEDHKLLTFLGKGELAVNGFRNRDLRAWLYPTVETLGLDQQSRRTGQRTRRIRLLRAHGLVRKVTGVNRYVVTSKGRRFAVALLGASVLPVERVMEMAS